MLSSLYAPNIDDAHFFDHLFSHFPNLGSHYSILGGGGGHDFNCWLDPVLDCSSTKPGVVSKSALHIQCFLSKYGISDIWRYSFFSHIHHKYSRVDYIFINRLIPYVSSCTYQSIVISDHSCFDITVTSWYSTAHKALAF